uniref:Secreted protein n=1 Tax=Heterorhabditis bacteriophora TaxID=37862 RepID=A0A1I7XGC3_HETBA
MTSRLESLADCKPVVFIVMQHVLMFVERESEHHMSHILCLSLCDHPFSCITILNDALLNRNHIVADYYTCAINRSTRFV